MYKKYIKKRGRLIGPYYYESIRQKNGKIRAFYLGKDPDSQNFKDKVALLKLKSAVRKGESVIIPVGVDVERPRRPFKINPNYLALKYFFGENVAKIKSNFRMPKLPSFSFNVKRFVKLPKVALPKLPEFKTTREFGQRKLEEYVPKPGANDFDFHAALFVLLGVIFVFGFFFLQDSYIGLTPLEIISNLTQGDVGQQIVSGENETAIIEESSATLVVLNVLNYSCMWNGSIFRVCESVEWSGGKYAKGYITGGDSIKDAEAFAISPFSYCQDVDKEGKKAVNAYVLDESKKIVKSDLSNKVECAIGNETVVTISNETVNESVMQNVTGVNVTELNITNVSEQNTSEINVSDINVAEINISELNETIVNITIQTASEQTIQYQAIAGQPVRWKRVIKLENETSGLEIDLPKGSKVISIKEIENETVKDITADVFASATPITGLSFLLTGLAIAEDVNATSVVIEQPVNEVEIEYETEAPTLEEEDLDNGKRLTISSNVHYDNVYVEINITESRGELIRLYWIVNGTRRLHPIIDYDDNNFDGFIDEIAFIAPHLSTEIFELILITKAEHLDSNYTFISDIYNETRELDDVWSEPIYHNEYIRVTFERNLTDQNDITVYVRNNQSLNTTIEVYYYNTTTKIIEFPVITEEDYYKVFLDSMNESYATFDLRIKNLDGNNSAYLEFDHIIDPTVTVIGGNEAHDVSLAIMNGSVGEFIMAWCDDVADFAYWEGFYTNGSNFTANSGSAADKHRFQAVASDNCRIGISALNHSDFAVTLIDMVTAAAPDWVVYAKTKTNGSIRQRTLIDTDVAGTAWDTAVAALNESSYVSFTMDGALDAASYSVHNRAAGTAITNLDLSITDDAGCLDQDCVDVATIGNVSSLVSNRTRAHVWYDDTSDVIWLRILNGNNQNTTGATQNAVNVDAPGTAAGVSVSGLYDGRLVVAWCDQAENDVSFKTYDVAINSSVVSNVSGEVDVNLTSGSCAGAGGAKVDVAALNATNNGVAEFVYVWDDARVNQTSFAIYYSNGSRKVAQTLVDAQSDDVEKQVSAVGYDVMRNVSVCEYAPLPAFVVSWNNRTNMYWRTYLNNGSQWTNSCFPAPPVVNLTSPPNATSNSSTSHVFFSNATSTVDLNNATLYANFSGSWAVEGNGTVTVSGTSVQTAYIADSGISAGGYVWNVLWCDDSNQCRFNSQNFTLTVEAAANSAPPIPALLNPTVNNVTTNRTPFFNWTDSVDPNGDPVNYTLNITCLGGCAGDTRIINVVNRTNFTLTDDLEFFSDDGYNYTWTVLATDGLLNSSYNESARNLSIYTLIDLSIPSGNVSFGSMTLGANNDTDDNSPAPFRLQNNGNILINVSINGTSLWSTDASPTSRYQYKIDNVSGENNSFVWSQSNTTFTNMPTVDNVAIIGLNYTDATDSAQIDINITVPPAEPPANLTSTVRFRGAR